MNENFKGFLGFWRGIFSESDGTPSASRLTMYTLALVSAAVIVLLVTAVIRADVSKASLILVALPGIIGALALFFSTPYGANKLSSVISSFSNKNTPPSGQ